ncbi:MAG: tRNA (5-methylaminomethyl-2-thiouridine)(34)-methyltransferase MnmD [Marinoscillum sp.]
MTNHKLKLITTQDGSHSLLREDMNETYHSFHGALGESKYVFIEQGLEYLVETKKLTEISVLEVGFGTGLNAYLSAICAQNHQVKINYHTLEPYPVPEELYARFNFAETDKLKALLQQLHQVEWGQPIQVSSFFNFQKYQVTLEEFESKELFDVIFFDAFAPSKQAEVWQLSNIQKCFDSLNKEGILTTYCAQGQFKRNLKSAGFEIETLKGAQGKKEMVRGIK